MDDCSSMRVMNVKVKTEVSRIHEKPFQSVLSHLVIGNRVEKIRPADYIIIYTDTIVRMCGCDEPERLINPE